MNTSDSNLYDIYEGLEEKLERTGKSNYSSHVIDLLRQNQIEYSSTEELIISKADKEIMISYGTLTSPLEGQGGERAGLLASELIHINKYILRYAIRDTTHTMLGYGKSEDDIEDIGLQTETVRSGESLADTSCFNTSSWSKKETTDFKRIIEGTMDEDRLRREIYDY